MHRGRIVQVNPQFPYGEFAGSILVVYESTEETIVGQLYSLAFNDLDGVMIRIRRDQVTDTGGELPVWPPEWLAKESTTKGGE